MDDSEFKKIYKEATEQFIQNMQKRRAISNGMRNYDTASSEIKLEEGVIARELTRLTEEIQQIAPKKFFGITNGKDRQDRKIIEEKIRAEGAKKLILAEKAATQFENEKKQAEWEIQFVHIVSDVMLGHVVAKDKFKFLIDPEGLQGSEVNIPYFDAVLSQTVTEKQGEVMLEDVIDGIMENVFKIIQPKMESILRASKWRILQERFPERIFYQLEYSCEVKWPSFSGLNFVGLKNYAQWLSDSEYAEFNSYLDHKLFTKIEEFEKLNWQPILTFDDLLVGSAHMKTVCNEYLRRPEVQARLHTQFIDQIYSDGQGKFSKVFPHIFDYFVAIRTDWKRSFCLKNATTEEREAYGVETCPDF